MYVIQRYIGIVSRGSSLGECPMWGSDKVQKREPRPPLALPRPRALFLVVGRRSGSSFWPFQPGRSGKGQRPLGWLKEWHIWQERSLLGCPTPLSRVGYGSEKSRALRRDHATRFLVGVLAKTLKRGDGMPPGSLKSMNSTVMDIAMAVIAFWAARRADSSAKVGSWSWRVSMRRETICGSFQVFVTASFTSCTSGDVKPAIHRMRLGIVSVSKGIASKVISGSDQIFCLRIISIMGWEMPEARKVIRGWLLEGARTGGGAILASGSLLPAISAISSTAFLKRPVRMGCLAFWFFPSYPKKQTKNFCGRTLHQA